jgi:extracellular factor (EF) 3-hydroxypalmitic acid methyl ester biosynthesis protein
MSVVQPVDPLIADRSTVLVEWLRALVRAGGPLPDQYQEVHRWLEATEAVVNQGGLSRTAVHALWREVGAEFLHDTMQGFATRKPYGYAGDFEIIDRIYTQWVSSNPKFIRWDHFFHAQSAPRAVRNRKAFFQSKMVEVIGGRAGDVTAVLNLGCGPCRDVAEFLVATPHSAISIDCVDQDLQAIAYAKALVSKADPHAAVRFIQANVVRFRPERSYDLIWSAGLFDYLPDRLFVEVLSRLTKHVRPGGQVVV